MRLALFFSRGMSLAGWQRAGLLDRELALYRALRPSLDRITFVTYGGDEEQGLATGIDGLTVLPNRWRLPANLYALLAPWLHRRALRDHTVFKSNQFNGAWMALLAAGVCRTPLVARSGFLWSEFVARLHPGSWRVPVARWLEGLTCRRAAAVTVATAEDRDVVIARHQVPAARVHVIPNYVDTHAFTRLPQRHADATRLIWIGRMDAQKNLPLLFEALAGLPGVTLDVVGDGPDRAALAQRAAALGARVRFLGRRPHAELPVLLNEAAVFVMPSRYEGHPKALLEAMACGTAVVGTRVPGIATVIQHDVTGWLCEPTAEALRDTLRAALGDAERRDRVGAAAMAWVRERCSLAAVARAELALLQQVAANSGRVGRE